MASIAEINEAVDTARAAGAKDLILLKCTSSYPATPDTSNLLTIPHMRDLFQCPVGLSDHTLGIGAAVASVALGAVAIEKHVTLARAEGGVDADFSLEPQELKSLVDECKRAWHALGGIQYGMLEEERASTVFRRSLYIAADMKAGETFTRKNLRAVRPGLGLPPKYLDMLLGKKIARNAKKGTAMSWDLVG